MRVKGSLALAGAAMVTVALAARGVGDDKGDALLKTAFNKLHAATTFSAKVSQTSVSPQGERNFKGTLLAMKPNFFRFEMEGTGAPIFVSDGKNYFMAQVGAPNYQKAPVDAAAKQMMGPWEGEVDAFFGGAEAGAKTESTITGSETINGVDCHLLTVKMDQPMRTVTYAIGKDDLKIHRSALRIPLPDGKEFLQTNVLTDIKLDAPQSAGDFEFKPPAGVKPLARADDPTSKLLPIGSKAPDFSLSTPKVGKISLQDGLSRSKALLVYFWFYNSGRGREEFPHLQALYAELRNKGLEVIAVNYADPKGRINQYAKEGRFTFPIAMGGPRNTKDHAVFENYGVMAFPTNYILDSHGNVVYRSLEIDEKAIRTTLEKLGVK